MSHPKTRESEMVASPVQFLIRSVAFAAEKHRGQRRKDKEGSPYINHPIALANLLANEASQTDVDVLCAAILHDTIEDTQTTPEEVATNFGTKVRDMVQEVTDNKGLLKEVRKQRQIEHSPHLSDGAKLIKLADKICNLRDVSDSPPTDWSLERRIEYFEWAKKVIDGLRGVHIGLEALFDAEYSKMPGMFPPPQKS